MDSGAIFDTSAKQREAHVLKWCIKNCSIVKLYYNVLINMMYVWVVVLLLQRLKSTYSDLYKQLSLEQRCSKNLKNVNFCHWGGNCFWIHTLLDLGFHWPKTDQIFQSDLDWLVLRIQKLEIAFTFHLLANRWQHPKKSTIWWSCTVFKTASPKLPLVRILPAIIG